MSRENLRRLVQGDLASVRVVLGLALIWIIFQSQNDRFLTAQNLTNLMLQITAIGLISVGIVFVLLLGEIDLSVGAISGLCAAIMVVLNVQHGWSPYLAIAAGVAAGASIGFAQGFLFSRFKVPSFVVTLAGLLAWAARSFCRSMANSGLSPPCTGYLAALQIGLPSEVTVTL